MAITYDTRSAEIFIDGQKVDHSGVVVTYDPPKPTFAEYLARRERALGWLTYLDRHCDEATCRELNLFDGKTRPQIALIMARDAPPDGYQVDRTPLPLP